MREPLVSSYNGVGATCLHFAVKTQNYDLVSALLSSVEKSNRKEQYARMITTIAAGDSKGDTPLHWLVEMTDEESIRIANLLLDTLEGAEMSVEDFLNHIDPNSTPNCKNNLLMRAAKAGNMEMCKVLLTRKASKFEGGAELFETDTFETAAEYAYDSKFFDLSYYLNKDMGMKTILKVFGRDVILMCSSSTLVMRASCGRLSKIGVWSLASSWS